MTLIKLDQYIERRHILLLHAAACRRLAREEPVLAEYMLRRLKKHQGDMLELRGATKIVVTA